MMERSGWGESLVAGVSRLLSAALMVGVLACLAAGDDRTTAEPPAERLLTPEEVAAGAVPNVVQLDEDAAPVPWDPTVVDDFRLVDQTGKEVTKQSLLGRPWVVNFIFTRCVTACPMTCRKMMTLIESVPDVDVKFVSITVDPENDDVKQMATFAEIWQADPNRWLFCTGEKDDVYKLIRTGFKVAAWVNVGEVFRPGYEFAHDNHLLHIDAQGRILGRYNSMVDDELALLGKVLRGEIETPQKHRPEVVAARTKSDLVDLSNWAEAKLGANQPPAGPLPAWAERLPATNAMLNGLATILLLVGLMAIKAKRVEFHKQMMVSAFGVSIVFLGCYLAYHYALHHYTGTHGKAFTGQGPIRALYFGILISHVILAATVPVLAIVTLVKGLRQKWESHRKWAKVTFPIWLYVSVTGVIIYWMLYKL